MAKKIKNSVGKPHIEMAEVSLIPDNQLSTSRDMRRFLSEISEVFKLEIIDTTIHEFDPHGITGVAIVGESHIAVHTWPEFNYAHVLISSCNSLPPVSDMSNIFENMGYNVIEDCQ